ncbi:MAG TPA: HAMP domain-containing sensor histidine kinase [Solirubrobacteraceae bacterium]|nr:HAMP domain-containing sensor histidine kinase [Solirubrobacteraceae bacterium]
MSIRRRLLATSLLTLAIGLGALLVVGNVLLDRRVEAETSSLLHGRAEAEIAALSLSEDGVKVRKTPNDAELDRRSWVFEHGHILESPPSAPRELQDVAEALGRAGRPAELVGPGETRLLARPLRAHGSGPVVGTVVVAVSTTSLESLQSEVLLGSLVLAALVLLAGWLAIRGALEGALGPVAQMTAAAEDWSEHDLDHRFGLGPARDELTGLAATLDSLLGRISASRRHEQRFASEVAHELRTPLARMRGRAELALGSEAGGERDVLRGVVEQTERLDRSIDALMAVARAELDPAQGRVDLASIAAELDDVAVSAGGPLPQAEGDPEVVRRALAPLVENARRHARSAVRIELSAGEGHVRAAVRDDGPGLGPGDPERLFEPGARGEDAPGDGAGLGLALARRLARSCGGDVVAGPGPGGCVVLELPAVGGPPRPVR